MVVAMAAERKPVQPSPLVLYLYYQEAAVLLVAEAEIWYSLQPKHHRRLYE